MDAVQVGRQVRYWRMRRGMTRQQFADRVGRSTSWVDKVEAGTRTLERLPVLERVADALGVTIQALTDPDEAEAAARAPDPAEVAAIRGALGQYEVLLGAQVAAAEHPRLFDLARSVRHLDAAFLASNFSEIGRHLPRVIIEAQRLAEDRGSVEATRLLVKTYRIASSTLLKLGADETAWLAADRAVTAARRVEDLYCLGRATRAIARAMTSLGQTEYALDALLAVAGRMEPELGRRLDLEATALYGMVLLTAEISAAKLGDAHTAQSMHEEAGEVAARWFAAGHDPSTAFGTTNVALHRVSALVRLGQTGAALDYVRRIDREDLARLPRERRGTFMLDVATAHYRMGHYQQAVGSLLEVDRIAPEEARCRPPSRAMIAGLLADVNHSPGAPLRALARRAGVQS